MRAVQGLPLRQIYLNIVTDTLRLMNEHHLMHPPLLRAIALYVIVSLNNKVGSAMMRGLASSTWRSSPNSVSLRLVSCASS